MRAVGGSYNDGPSPRLFRFRNKIEVVNRVWPEPAMVRLLVSVSCVVLFTKEVVRSRAFTGSRTLMDEQNTNEKDAVESRRTAKKLYQDPVFRYEKVFETMALSCGKVNATEFQCRFHRQSS